MKEHLPREIHLLANSYAESGRRGWQTWKQKKREGFASLEMYMLYNT